jgi:beta-phosphoglucomutase
MAQGVIFDMDGVLVDSAAAHQGSWQMLAKRHGVDVTPERFRETFGRRSGDIIRMLWGKPVNDEQIRRYDTEKEQLYRELITGKVPYMPGTRQVLERLRQAGYRLAVATSGPPENLQLVLDEGNLWTSFSATVNGREVSEGKPAPDCFRLAADRLQLAPGDCLVVEDAPVGIEAALAAEMHVIGVAGTHPREKLLEAGAPQVLAVLADLTPECVAARFRAG